MRQPKPKTAEFSCAFGSPSEVLHARSRPVPRNTPSLTLVPLDAPPVPTALTTRQGTCVGVGFFQEYVFIHFQGQQIWKCLNAAVEKILREQGKEWPWGLMEYDHDSLKDLLGQYSPCPVQEMMFRADWHSGNEAVV